MTSAAPRYLVPAPSAPLGRRALASLVDAVLVVPVAVAPLGSVLAEWLRQLTDSGWDAVDSPPDALGTMAVATALGGALGVVQWWAHGAHGWTIGRRLTGLRTVDVRTGEPIGMWRALQRTVLIAGGALACLVGQFLVLASPLFDDSGRRRGWHDRLTGAEVVDVRGRATTRRTAARSGPARGRRPAPVELEPVPVEHPAAPGGAGRVEQPTGPAPLPRAAGLPPAQDAHAAAARRLNALLADRRPATGGLVLPPLREPGVSPDVDTRMMAVVRPVQFAGDAAARREGAQSPHDVVPDRRPAHGQPVDDALDPALELTHRAPARAREPLAAPEPSADPSVAEIELHDGRLVRVAGAAVVGRNPVAATGVQVVRVVDPGRSVSKTHLQIGVEGDAVWVADRGSTNGTLVTLADGQQIVCGPEQHVRLPVGATVSFGNCGLRLIRGPRARQQA